MKDNINKYVKHIPYEGTEIDITGLETFIEGLLKGMITHAHMFNKTKTGYSLGNKHYSREDIVKMFLNDNKIY